MKKLLIFILLFSQMSWAAAPEIQEPLLLNQGQPAPYTGFLLSRDKVDSVYKLSIDLDFQTKKADILSSENQLLISQNDRNKDFIETQSKQISSMKENSTFTKIAFFFLGAACATLVAYGAARAGK